MAKEQTQGMNVCVNLNEVINSIDPYKLSYQDMDDVITIIGRYHHVEQGNNDCYYHIIDAPNQAVFDFKLSSLIGSLIQWVQDISRLKEQKGENMTQEFLKLNSDPNYYRFDLYALLTSGLGHTLADDIDGFDTACQVVDEYVANNYDIKSVWGWGAAKHDKGTVFENNDGYYLFFNVSNHEQGERIESDVINLFGAHGLYCNADDCV